MTGRSGSRSGRYALIAAGLYVLTGSIWIVASDLLVDLADEPAELQTLKGLGYVVVTGVVLGLVLWRLDRARHRLEREVREAQKMEAVGQMAGGVAHDFNNLLAVILVGAEILREELSAKSPARDVVEDIRTASRRGADLAGRLLMFSRAQPAEAEVLVLDEVVEGVQRMLQRAVGESVRLNVDLQCGDARVHADHVNLDQIMMNLAVNARDAMPEGGELHLRTRCDEDHAVLEVEDTGTGMSEDTRARIFEPFFTTKAAGQGTGLGLSTVRSVVHDMGGTIEVDSEPGRGSTFRVRIPLTGRVADVRQAESGRPTASGRGETVLLVDDDAGVRRMVQRLLERDGYRVLSATGPGEAILLAEQHGDRIDLLLTDVVMPLLRGPALARRIRETIPDVPILFMSGHPTYGDGESVPPNARLIHKPISRKDMLEAVRAALAETGRAEHRAHG